MWYGSARRRSRSVLIISALADTSFAARPEPVSLTRRQLSINLEISVSRPTIGVRPCLVAASNRLSARLKPTTRPAPQIMQPRHRFDDIELGADGTLGL